MKMINEFDYIFQDKELIDSKAKVLFTSLNAILIANKSCNINPVVLGITKNDFYILTSYMMDKISTVKESKDENCYFNGIPIVLSEKTGFLYPIESQL